MTADDLKTLIIIPAYNEQDCILNTVGECQKAGYDYVVVNDGSTDSTLEICKKHKLNVLDLKSNLGIGGAVQAGHKYARENGYDVDIQFDGDGQHDINYVSTLLEQISKGSDVVIGSRFIKGQESKFQSSFMRRAGIKWLSKLIRLTTGKRITDPTSGFRACNARAIDLFAKHYPTDYPEPESIVSALRTGLKVDECPVEMNERQGGQSSIRALSSVYYMIKVTIAMLIAGAGSSKE